MEIVFILSFFVYVLWSHVNFSDNFFGKKKQSGESDHIMVY